MTSVPKLWTSAELRAEGVDLACLRRMLRADDLARVRRDIYVSSAELHAIGKDERRLHALQVQALQRSFATSVVAGGTSAARIYGLEFLDPPSKEIVVVGGLELVSSTHRDGYRLRRAVLPPEHVYLKYGVALTTPARTIVDLAAEMSFMAGLVLADSGVRKRLVTVEELRETAVATVPFRRGLPKVLRVIDAVDPLSESPLESASRAAFIELGIPKPLTQFVLIVGDEEYRLDFLWPEVEVSGEADGMNKYRPVPGEDPLAAVRREKTREQDILTTGLEMVRWGWAEVRNQQILDRRLRAAFARGTERRRGRLA